MTSSYFFRRSAKEGNVIHYKRTPGNGHGGHMPYLDSGGENGKTLTRPSYLLHCGTMEKRQKPIEFTAINPEPLMTAACLNCKRCFCIFVINHSCRTNRVFEPMLHARLHGTMSGAHLKEKKRGGWGERKGKAHARARAH